MAPAFGAGASFCLIACLLVLLLLTTRVMLFLFMLFSCFSTISRDFFWLMFSDSSTSYYQKCYQQFTSSGVAATSASPCFVGLLDGALLKKTRGRVRSSTTDCWLMELLMLLNEILVVFMSLFRRMFSWVVCFGRFDLVGSFSFWWFVQVFSAVLVRFVGSVMVRGKGSYYSIFYFLNTQLYVIILNNTALFISRRLNSTFGGVFPFGGGPWKVWHRNRLSLTLT